MGRILTKVKVKNFTQPDKSMNIDVLVDTGAAYLTLPMAWKEQLGQLEKISAVNIELANQSRATADVYGPIRLQVEGFREIITEVLFLQMNPNEGGEYEPLLGYIPLEQSQVAVDMLGHRLVPVKYVDCK